MILDYVKIIIDNLKNQKNNIIQVSKVVVRDATKDSITIQEVGFSSNNGILLILVGDKKVVVSFGDAPFSGIRHLLLEKIQEVFVSVKKVSIKIPEPVTISFGVYNKVSDVVSVL